MMMFVYQNEPDGLVTVKWWVLQKLFGFRFLSRKDDGWLCKLNDGDHFLLAHDMLPDLLKALDWIDRPEEMTVRIETIGKYKAVDFLLQDLPFGDYLKIENFYQAWLNTRNGEYLVMMARLLYSVGEGEDFSIGSFLPLSVFLWYSAVKHRFAEQFSHFLKPVENGQSTGDKMSQYETIAVQIRLLTKGDVTKNEQVMNTPTWDALTELDALARDAEELKKKKVTKPG